MTEQYDPVPVNPSHGMSPEMFNNEVQKYKDNCNFFRQKAAELTEQQLANLAWYLVCSLAANIRESDRWEHLVESAVKWAKEQP
jgi:hypothetical protein